jgi:hypothetical protein
MSHVPKDGEKGVHWTRQWKDDSQCTVSSLEEMVEAEVRLLLAK